MPWRMFYYGEKQVKIVQAWKPDGKGGTEIGFGASVYDAAIVLSYFIHKHQKEWVRNKRVIELGCGTGLVGIAAALSGAQETFLTDGDPMVVGLAQRNIELNGCTSCTAFKYLWGTDIHEGTPLGMANHPPFDVIVAADIVACPYESSFQSLVKAFMDLSGRNTKILLAYKKRHESEQVFFQTMAATFQWSILRREEMHPDFQSSDIQIYIMQRI